MISTLLSVVLFAGSGCPPIAPPINPRFNTRALVGCVCDDSGVCVCAAAECGCADCPRENQPAKPSTPMPTKTRKVLKPFFMNGRFIGYEVEYVETVPLKKAPITIKEATKIIESKSVPFFRFEEDCPNCESPKFK